MKKLFVMLLNCLLFSSMLCAMQPEVLTVDLDDVVSIKQKVGLGDYATLLPRILFWHPTFLATLFNFNKIQMQGEKIGRDVDGASNIIHQLVQKLKEDGYSDLSYYEPEIVARSVNPKPLSDVITFLKDLKKKGYVLIGATNQDYMQNKSYRNKMKDQGQDLQDLFDAIVTTRVNHLNEVNGKPIDEQEPFTQVEDMIYMVNSPTGVKPQEGYYEVLKKVGKKLNPSAKRFIHVDDRIENVEGAKKVDDFEGVHFNLPAGSARKSSPEELANALEGYKKGLEKLGIDGGQANEMGHSEGALAL